MSTHEQRLPLFDMVSRPEMKRYRTLVADPPWAAVMREPRRFVRTQTLENGGEVIVDGRKNDFNAYPTMTNDQLANMPTGLWAEDDAHLYLWCLNSNILEAHRIAKAWGFEVKTVITWVKGRMELNRLIQHIGLGHYYRNSTEHVLFGVRGSLPTLVDDLPTAFVAPRKEHSEKPAAFYDMVLRASPGPYLDVFARAQRFEFDTFGNESFDFREHGIWNQ